MTYAQFFERLARSTRRWRLVGSRQMIRSGETCPIVAVAGGWGLEWWNYNIKLGLSYRMAQNLVKAADHNTFPSDIYDGTQAARGWWILRLRKRMLKAVGLHEIQ